LIKGQLLLIRVRVWSMNKAKLGFNLQKTESSIRLWQVTTIESNPGFRYLKAANLLSQAAKDLEPSGEKGLSVR